MPAASRQRGDPGPRERDGPHRDLPGDARGHGRARSNHRAHAPRLRPGRSRARVGPALASRRLRRARADALVARRFQGPVARAGRRPRAGRPLRLAPPVAQGRARRGRAVRHRRSRHPGVDRRSRHRWRARPAGTGGAPVATRGHRHAVSGVRRAPRLDAAGARRDAHPPRAPARHRVPPGRACDGRRIRRRVQRRSAAPARAAAAAVVGPRRAISCCAAGAWR